MPSPTIPLPPEEALRAHALLASWPLGEVLRLEAVPGGATNRVYRVETAARIAFLRIYKRADRALAEREHALIAQVRAQGLPVVPLIAARSGSTVVEHAGSVAALYEPAAGVQLRGADLSPEQVSSAGALLARLHRALAPVQDAGYLHWTLSWDGPAWVERLNVVERAIVGFMFRLRPEPTRRFLRAYASANALERDALEDGARAWGCFADHHVWPLEELYLNGNEAARRYIPHAPFRPFGQGWAELGLQ